MSKRIQLSEFIDLFNKSVAKHRNSNDPIPEMATDSYGKIEGCLNAPFATFDKKDLYPTIQDKAAILIYLLIKNHPLQNGNKRMAYITFCYFLLKNGEDVYLDSEDTYEFTKHIAASESSDKDEIIQYIKKVITPPHMDRKEYNEKKAKLEKAIASPATPQATKETMKKILETMEAKQSELVTEKKPIKNKPVKSQEKDKEADYFQKVQKAIQKRKKISAEDAINYMDKTVVTSFENGEKPLIVANRLIKEFKPSLKKEKQPTSKSPKSVSPKPVSKGAHYDCDELIKKANKQRKAAKERAQEPKPTAATKNKTAIENVAQRVTTNIEKRIDKGEVKTKELDKLIGEAQKFLNTLKLARKKL